MTIKQQGGIFGRNPTFNEINTDGDVSVGGDLTVETDVTVSNGNLSITQSTPTIDLIDLQDVNDVAQIFSSAGNLDLKADINNDKGSSRIKFEIDGSEVGRWNDSGNLVIANSGNGIDFSATSGTGTSELFDDYEEGSFTATLTTSGTDFSSVTYDAVVFGSYTKVGNVVHIQLLMQTDAVTKGSASGNVLIGGLPFAADGTAPLALATSKDWLANYPTRAYVADGATTISLLTNANNTADDENVVVADVKTLANDNTLRLSGTYRAS